MRNTKILIAIILLVLIGILLLVLSSNKKQGPQQTIPPIQSFSASPTATPAIIIPQELEPEKVKQENYAKTREEFVKAKPWILKLPLKADNYFVSYNPDSDTIVVELYYLDNSTASKDQQLFQAKQTALNAITAVGIDTNTQKIEYLELLKKK